MEISSTGGRRGLRRRWSRGWRVIASRTGTSLAGLKFGQLCATFISSAAIRVRRHPSTECITAVTWEESRRGTIAVAALDDILDSALHKVSKRVVTHAVSSVFISGRTGSWGGRNGVSGGTCLTGLKCGQLRSALVSTTAARVGSDKCRKGIAIASRNETGVGAITVAALWSFLHCTFYKVCVRVVTKQEDRK